MSKQFIAYNGAGPTAASITPVTTGTALKTMMQLANPAGVGFEVVGWSVDFDGAAFGTKIRCELIDTNVAATVTAYIAGGIVGTTNPAAEGSQMTLGTGASGFTGSAEGTITAARLLDYHLVDQSGAYGYTWPLGNYPRVAASRFLRVRVTASAAVNAICSITWQEG